MREQPAGTSAQVGTRADFLISQYEQCWYDVRDHRTRFWQLLLSSALVNGALLALAVQVVTSALPEVAKDATTGAILVAMGTASVVLVIQAYKERFFEIVRSRYADHIRHKFAEAVDIKFRSSDIIAQLGAKNSPIAWDTKGFFRESWIFKTSAWNWLRYSLIALPIATGAAALLILLL